MSNTLQHLLSMRQPKDVQLAEDGQQVAFVVSALESGGSGTATTRIWTGPSAGGVRQVTRGPGSDILPRFSPDGGRLAFASDRDHPGRFSLYLLDAGAEALPQGDVPGSIEEIRWSGDGARIFVLSADAGSDKAGIQGATEIGGDEVTDPEVRRPPASKRRLYRVDLGSGDTTEVGPDNRLTVWEFSLYGDRAVAIVSEDATEGGWYHGWIAAIDLGRREVTRLHTPEWQVQCPRLSPDGRHLAWIENLCSDRGVVAGTINVLEPAGGEPRQLAPEADVTELDWISDRALRVCGPRGTRSFVGTVNLADGHLEELFCGQVRLGARHQVNATSDAAGRLFAAVREAPGIPPEVAILDATDPGSGWREVSALNGDLKQLAVPQVEEITWTADDGLEIEGLLVRPTGVDGALPMIVTIHGGPTACWGWAFSPGFWNCGHLFAEAGYAVLLPNPRGSAGRGREFACANLGDVGGNDFRDILAGTAACVERGFADGDALGAWGASYGGFMSAWMVGNTDIFKAIIPVSCHTNWLSFHNTSNIPSFDQLFVGAEPYEADDKYFHLSPVVHASKATTPTLFLHGALDKICPVSQAEEMYRAIAETGVETELVIYPREGHGVTQERDHFIDAWNRILAWMDRHLRQNDPARDGAS